MHKMVLPIIFICILPSKTVTEAIPIVRIGLFTNSVGQRVYILQKNLGACQR